MTKTRWFVVTNWNRSSEADYKALIAQGQIRFIAYGAEVCPETKREHHQCFIYFHNPQSTSNKNLNKIGNMFGEKHAYVQAMFGSVQQNEAYCSKEGSFTKVGDEPKQGLRMQLHETVDMVFKGELSVDEIVEKDPMCYHQYGRTLEKAETIALRRKWRTEMTLGIWLYGESGGGKGHYAFENYNPVTDYRKGLKTDWWDGYKGQPTVIFDEFRGSHMPFNELLTYVDKWPLSVKVRNKEDVPFLAKKLIITCEKHPKDAYWGIDENWWQFKRRFCVINIGLRNEFLQKTLRLSNSNNTPSAVGTYF